jgi:hypothetical protein
MNAVERLRGLLEKGTPGPWRVLGETHQIGAAYDWWVGPPARETDADLIVAAVNALPALLDVVEVAQEVKRWAPTLSNSKFRQHVRDLGDALARLNEHFPEEERDG